MRVDLETGRETGRKRARRVRAGEETCMLRGGLANTVGRVPALAPFISVRHPLRLRGVSVDHAQNIRALYEFIGHHAAFIRRSPQFLAPSQRLHRCFSAVYSRSLRS